MKLPSKKIIFLIGFILILLIAIPITVYLVQQQTKTKSSAAKATTLYIDAATKTVDKDAVFNLDIKVNPTDKDGITNLVTQVTMLITYDPTKLEVTGEKFVPNAQNFPTTNNGPVYGEGTITITVSNLNCQSCLIQNTAKVGTISFKAIASTDPNTPTEVGFDTKDGKTAINANTANKNASIKENVLASALPAKIIINDNSTSQNPVCKNMSLDKPLTGTAPYTLGFTATGTSANDKISQISIDFGDGETASPDTEPDVKGYGTPLATASANHTYTTKGTYTANATIIDSQQNEITGCEKTITISEAPVTQTTAPVCSALDVNKDTSGTAPFTITFTANGTDSDSTISKVSFDFDDGPVSDLTSTGGIGTKSVTIPASHTYNTAGTFTVSATLTNSKGITSDPTECTQTITVTQANGTVSEATPSATPTDTPTPTPTPTIEIGPSPLPPTGPNGLFTIGILGGILTTIGVILLLAL